MWPDINNSIRSTAIVIGFLISLNVGNVSSGDDQVRFGELPDCGQRELIKSKRLVYC